MVKFNLWRKYALNFYWLKIEIHYLTILNMQVTKNRKEHVIQTNHGASHPKLSDLLLKFGLTWTLLPYVGEWKEWHLVMNLACTQTRKVWKDSLTGYKGLYKSVSWRTHKNEIEEIYKKKFRTSIDIAERTNLFLMASWFSDVSFIIASREMRFPKMNRLELWKTDSLPIYAIKHVSKFLKCCSQGKINELVINSELQMDFSLFNEGLKAVVSNTNRSIKLENLYLNQEVLCTIFKTTLSNWI